MKEWLCYPYETTIWKTYSDATLGCTINPSCTQFWTYKFDVGDESTSVESYNYCQQGSKTEGNALATLYKKGKMIDKPYYEQYRTKKIIIYIIISF